MDNDATYTMQILIVTLGFYILYVITNRDYWAFASGIGIMVFVIYTLLYLFSLKPDAKKKQSTRRKK